MFSIREMSFWIPGFWASFLFVSVLNGQDNQVQQRLKKLEDKIELITQRLDRMENVLFATIKFSEVEARRQLKQAKAELAKSERLHAQGLLSAIQLRLDRMSLDRAESLLKMCLRHEDHQRIGATLEVLDAKQDYERKKFALDHTLEMFERGLAAKGQIGLDRTAVLMAGQKLKLAETRLKNLGKPKPQSEKKK